MQVAAVTVGRARAPAQHDAHVRFYHAVDAHVRRFRSARNFWLQHDAHVTRRSTALASAHRLEAGSLPSPKRSRVEGQIRAAGKVLAEAYASSPVVVDGPTPERVRQAGSSFDMGVAIRSVEVTKGGQRQTEEIRTPRARVDVDPFTRMVQRGQLDTESEDMNRWMGEAGARYRRLHEKAGRGELQGQDPTKGFTTANQGPTVLLDRMLDAWDAWDKASTAMHPCHRRVVDAIVLQGVKPEDVGAEISGYAAGKKSVVAAMVLLRFGLQDLDRHFAAVDAQA